MCVAVAVCDVCVCSCLCLMISVFSLVIKICPGSRRDRPNRKHPPFTRCYGGVLGVSTFLHRRRPAGGAFVRCTAAVCAVFRDEIEDQQRRRQRSVSAPHTMPSQGILQAFPLKQGVWGAAGGYRFRAGQAGRAQPCITEDSLREGSGCGDTHLPHGQPPYHLTVETAGVYDSSILATGWADTDCRWADTDSHGRGAGPIRNTFSAYDPYAIRVRPIRTSSMV